MHVNALVDAVILEGTDHLEAGAIADVSEPRIFVSAEIALQDAAVGSAIEHRAPGFELAYAVGCFLGVEFSHAGIVQVLAAAHGVRKMDTPVVAIVDVPHGGCDAAFGHDSVGFAKEGFSDDAHFDARGGCFDSGAESRATRSNDQDVMFESLIIGHR